MLVIAISLALPTSLHLVLNNTQTLLNSWDEQSNLTLFLESDISEKAGRKLGDKVLAWPEIKGARYIGADEALEDFRESSGLDEILSSLGENPLPAAVVLQPTKSDLDSLHELEKSSLN